MNAAPTNLRALFDAAQRDGETVACVAGARRRRLRLPTAEALLDSFDEGPCRSLFWRSRGRNDTRLRLNGTYRMTTADAGGWLLAAQDAALPSYWFPCPPALRRLDVHGRILEETPCPIGSLAVDSEGAEIRLGPTGGRYLDLVAWEIGAGDSGLLPQLERSQGPEHHPAYLWGSHDVYRQPADLYRNLVHGSIFDSRFSWPYKRRAFSENDAYTFNLVLRNREHATGKGLYGYLRDQVLLCVLTRQDSDGAWRQGIWTQDLECHFRLHCRAMHLLMDRYCEQPDGIVRDALARAAHFIAAQGVHVAGETWFLHDSLEQSEQAIRTSLPGWRYCANRMKDPANTLTLNTHIDTLITLHRYGQIAGDKVFVPLIASAQRALVRVMELKPAERLYRVLFRAIYLTLLPTERAKALPLPVRAIKRLAREWLIPLLPTLKCRFPRLVMPDGYIERALSLEGLEHAYLSINLMDLVRYEQFFPGLQCVRSAIANAIRFAGTWGLLDHWAENRQAQYALGYWVEALYRLAMLDERGELRQALGDAAILAERCGLGLSPTLGGTNPEVAAIDRRQPCPTPTDARLRTVNLARAGSREYLFLNPTDEAVGFALAVPTEGLDWRDKEGEARREPPERIDPGRWLWASERAEGQA